MLIKKDEEPFFYKFLAIAKEIIKKNPKYTPVFYGDDERLYLACGNHAAVYDFQSNLLLDDEQEEIIEDDYQEEEQLDALLEDTVVPEELEDDFDPMLA